jgi:hypothetical protein
VDRDDPAYKKRASINAYEIFPTPRTHYSVKPAKFGKLTEVHIPTIPYQADKQ